MVTRRYVFPDSVDGPWTEVALGGPGPTHYQGQSIAKSKCVARRRNFVNAVSAWILESGPPEYRMRARGPPQFIAFSVQCDKLFLKTGGVWSG
jgi:hypothetical protein